MRYHKDRSGERYGKLVLLKRDGKEGDGKRVRYICRCDCGEEKSILIEHLKRGNITSCGCSHKRGNEHPLFRGVGEISAAWWSRRIGRRLIHAKNHRALEVSVTPEYVWNLFLKQNKKCALTGIELTFPKDNLDTGGTASIDRIDNSKGYVMGNIQWVHKDINMMRNSYTRDYYISMCKKVASHNP